MSFRPSIHGWPFDNERSWDPSALGLGASPLPELGLGGGMCWAALDRYRAGVTIAPETPAPEPGDPLYAELVRRQVAALSGVWERVRAWQALPDSSPSGRIPGMGRDLSSRSRAEWRQARRRLEAGEPVLLTVLPDTDAYSRVRAAWQVLATGWSRDGGRIRLSLYDPGQPGDDKVQLSFAARGPLDARMTGGQALRAFFMVPYDRGPGAPLRAETFADRAVLGLNRKIRGRPQAVARGARLDVVARDPESALIHFRRERHASHWEGTNVTERESMGTHELHSDPRPVLVGSRLHVFARNYVGDLLHFRLGRRRWSLSNRTDEKRTGPRFRLAGDPVPVAGPRGRLSVLGRDPEGGLVHYAGVPLRGWSAEQVPGEPISGLPLGAWIGSTLHVVAVTGDRRLLAWERSREGSWVQVDLATGLEKGPSTRVAGSPAVVVHEDALHVFGRDPNGRLLHYQRSGDGRWAVKIRGAGITGDPSATAGPAGLHVVAPAGPHGLLHAWGLDEWHVEDVVATRPTLGGGAGWTGPVQAWGSHAELRIFGRQGPHLVVLAWRADSDWTATPLGAWAGVEARHQPADDPVLLPDGTGAWHLLATDGRGTVVHVEPGPWVEPGTETRSVERRHAPAPDAISPEPLAEPVTAVPRQDGIGLEPEPALDEEVEPLPLLESPEPDAEPRFYIEADFEAEALMAGSVIHTSQPSAGGGGADDLDTDDTDYLPDLDDPGEVAENPPAESDSVSRVAAQDGPSEEEPEEEPEVAEVAEAAEAAEAVSDPEAPLVAVPAAAAAPAGESEAAADEQDEADETGEEEPEDAIQILASAIGEPVESDEDLVDDVADAAGDPALAEAGADPDPWAEVESAPAVAEEAEPEEELETEPVAGRGGSGAATNGRVKASVNGTARGNGKASGNARAAGAGEAAEEDRQPEAPRKEFQWEGVRSSGERTQKADGQPSPADDLEPMDLSLLESWPPEPPLRKGSRKRKKDR